jgi:retron-type reverse transcriptase
MTLIGKIQKLLLEKAKDEKKELFQLKEKFLKDLNNTQKTIFADSMQSQQKGFRRICRDLNPG